jgi:hypothetical protein
MKKTIQDAFNQFLANAKRSPKTTTHGLFVLSGGLISILHAGLNEINVAVVLGGVALLFAADQSTPV